MTTVQTRSTSNRPFTGRCGGLRAVTTSGHCHFMSHLSKRLLALQLIAGYEDQMHPGRGSA